VLLRVYIAHRLSDSAWSSDIGHLPLQANGALMNYMRSVGAREANSPKPKLEKHCANGDRSWERPI